MYVVASCVAHLTETHAALQRIGQLCKPIELGVCPTSLTTFPTPTAAFISIKHFCGDCSTVRSNIAIARGLTEEKLLATMAFETSSLFDEREKGPLHYARLFKAGDDAIDSDAV
jgi:hypothetical protein